MQIEVILPGSQPVTHVSRQVQLRGVDRLDPELPINNLTLGAFAQAPERIEIIGLQHVGAFTRVDDVIRMEVVNSRPLSTRRVIYEFSGWQPRE